MASKHNSLQGYHIGSHTKLAQRRTGYCAFLKLKETLIIGRIKPILQKDLFMTLGDADSQL